MNRTGLHARLARLFQNSLLTLVAGTVAVFALTAGIEAYFAKRTLEQYLHTSIINSVTESAQRADIVFLQSDLRGIHQALAAILPARMELFRQMDGKLIAEVGSLTNAESYFTAQLTRDFPTISTHGVIRIHVYYSLLPILMIATARMLVFVALLLAGMLFLQSRIIKSVSALAVPVDQLLSWLDRKVQSQQENADESTRSTFDSTHREIVTGVERLVGMRTEYAKMESAHRIAEQVAHDIRSPLSALRILGQKMARGGDANGELIHHVAERLDGISTDLLRTYRPAAKPTSPVTPLNAELNRAVDEKSLTLENGKIELRKLLAPDVNVRIEPNEFHRMISNLINNSIEAFPHTDIGWIEVSTESKGTEICIRVTDNGPGIPADVLKQIGQRGQTFGKESGTGLGLFHAHQTAKQMNGRCELASTVGQGTTVSVYLPIA